MHPDATLLELEKTLLDATAKFAASKCNNSQANRDNCILSSPLGRAVMCKYDDEVTRSNNDDDMHLQSNVPEAAPTTPKPCSNVKYLKLDDNKCRIVIKYVHTTIDDDGS
jgi:hypothetical protein